jgi:hypothetical protein
MDITHAFLLVSVALYFLPTAIGLDRRHRTAIFVANFALGWTVVGWFAAMIWAVMAPHTALAAPAPTPAPAPVAAPAPAPAPRPASVFAALTIGQKLYPIVAFLAVLGFFALVQ